MWVSRGLKSCSKKSQRPRRRRGRQGPGSGCCPGSRHDPCIAMGGMLASDEAILACCAASGLPCCQQPRLSTLLRLWRPAWAVNNCGVVRRCIAQPKPSSVRDGCLRRGDSGMPRYGGVAHPRQGLTSKRANKLLAVRNSPLPIPAPTVGAKLSKPTATRLRCGGIVAIRG